MDKEKTEKAIGRRQTKTQDLRRQVEMLRRLKQLGFTQERVESALDTMLLLTLDDDSYQPRFDRIVRYFNEMGYDVERYR